MLNSIMFPQRYYQGKDALLQFGERAKDWAKSFLVVGSKTAMAAVRPKLEKSFEGIPVTVTFEMSSGVPSDSEYARVAALAEKSGAEAIVAVGGGGVIDIVRSAGMKTGMKIIVIPTSVASDAACTNVCIHYAESGAGIVGADIYHRGPDMVYVDSTVIAGAPARFLASGIGDGLATWYEAATCKENGVEQYGGLAITKTAMALAECCRDLILENGYQAMLAAKNGLVTPALESVIEACAMQSGVAGLNTGCAGAHGFGDWLSTTPGGHDWLHGERVAVGLVIQLILEDYPPEDINEIIRFLASVELPTSIADLGYANPAAIAKQMGEQTTNDRFIGHMANVDHSPAAIESAALAAVILAKDALE